MHNLAEAHREMESLQRKLYYLDFGTMPEEWRDEWDFREQTLSRGVMAAQIAHIYHHVNWAWNCRNADEDRAIRCDARDFRRWEKFPRNWPELWLPPSRCRKRFPKWRSPEYRWTLKHLTAMRIAIDRVEYTLGKLITCIAMRLGGESLRRWGNPERFAKCAKPITEEDFARMTRRIYARLNEAWNSRNLDLSKLPCSSRYFRDLKCFPRAFPEFWLCSAIRQLNFRRNNDR